jgi:hypothetical protein
MPGRKTFILVHQVREAATSVLRIEYSGRNNNRDPGNFCRQVVNVEIGEYWPSSDHAHLAASEDPGACCGRNRRLWQVNRPAI